jgi:hypothetical protein
LIERGLGVLMFYILCLEKFGHLVVPTRSGYFHLEFEGVAKGDVRELITPMLGLVAGKSDVEGVSQRIVSHKIEFSFLKLRSLTWP